MMAYITGEIRDQGSNFKHETAGLLPSVATIKKSLYHKRTPINIRPQEKTSRSRIRGWAKSLKNRRKHYKILKQDFIVLFNLIN